MAATQVELKSTFVPLFQRGILLRGILTPPFDGLRAGFGKEGKGRFSDAMTTDLDNELWFQDASFALQNDP
jgi:hypothetical protein